MIKSKKGKAALIGGAIVLIVAAAAVVAGKMGIDTPNAVLASFNALKR